MAHRQGRAGRGLGTVRRRLIGYRAKLSNQRALRCDAYIADAHGTIDLDTNVVRPKICGRPGMGRDLRRHRVGPEDGMGTVHADPPVKAPCAIAFANACAFAFADATVSRPAGKPPVFCKTPLDCRQRHAGADASDPHATSVRSQRKGRDHRADDPPQMSVPARARLPGRARTGSPARRRPPRLPGCNAGHILARLRRALRHAGHPPAMGAVAHDAYLAIQGTGRRTHGRTKQRPARRPPHRHCQIKGQRNGQLPGWVRNTLTQPRPHCAGRRSPQARRI